MTKSTPKAPPLYARIREILESARTSAARSVNTTQVMANWLIGREIVEEEQKGRRRAGYGQTLVNGLAVRLTKEYGKGYSAQNLWLFRQFFLTYPGLVSAEILYAVRREFGASAILHALRGDLTSSPRSKVPDTSLASCNTTEAFPKASHHVVPALSRGMNAARGESPPAAIGHAVRDESWAPGQLHPNLCWTHYRTLLRVDKTEACAFYEIEAIKNNWAARELERQINSLLYERLALSRDKKGLLRLATRGHEVQRPADVFKNPVVMEFLGLPESPRLVETDLEQALIDNLQAFLLELGKGFAFVARQERLTLEGDHFYIDLVFYHTILKCFVIVDLKTGKLTHQDLGQLQLYVNYYDRERRTEGDNPTLGLILCTDKNDTVVRYTLGPDQQKTIFASRYKLHLPTEAELKAELQREVRALSGRAKRGGAGHDR
jgi:predicted nuclease of restriction endonuclease-like (RecB) superfamily